MNKLKNSPDSRFKLTFQKAIEEISNSHFDEALKLLKSILRPSNEYNSSLYYKGLCYQAAKDNIKAESCFLESLKANVNTKGATYQLTKYSKALQDDESLTIIYHDYLDFLIHEAAYLDDSRIKKLIENKNQYFTKAQVFNTYLSLKDSASEDVLYSLLRRSGTGNSLNYKAWQEFVIFSIKTNNQKRFESLLKETLPVHNDLFIETFKLIGDLLTDKKKLTSTHLDFIIKSATLVPTELLYKVYLHYIKDDHNKGQLYILLKYLTFERQIKETALPYARLVISNRISLAVESALKIFNEYEKSLTESDFRLIGDYYLSLNNYLEAHKYYALLYKANKKEFLPLLEVLKSLKGDKSELISLYVSLTSLNLPYYYQLGLEYKALKKLPEAKEAFLKALDSNNTQERKNATKELELISNIENKETLLDLKSRDITPTIVADHLRAILESIVIIDAPHAQNFKLLFSSVNDIYKKYHLPDEIDYSIAPMLLHKSLEIFVHSIFSEQYFTLLSSIDEFKDAGTGDYYNPAPLYVPNSKQLSEIINSSVFIDYLTTQFVDKSLSTSEIRTFMIDFYRAYNKESQKRNRFIHSECLTYLQSLETISVIINLFTSLTDKIIPLNYKK